MNSFIAHILSLTVHKKGLCLFYQPQFWQHITQNPQIIIVDLELYKIKQICLSYRVTETGYKYHTHVLFFHIHI